MSKAMESYSNRLKNISITRECKIELTKTKYSKFYLGRKKKCTSKLDITLYTPAKSKELDRYSEIKRSQRNMNCYQKHKLIQSLQLQAPTGCASKLQFSSQMHRGSQEGSTLYIPTIAWLRIFITVSSEAGWEGES